MVITKSELGHYYFANKKNNISLSSIETQKKPAMKKSYAWNICAFLKRCNDPFLYFSNLLVQFLFSFEFSYTNAREILEEQEMMWKHKPQTSDLTTFLSSPKCLSSNSNEKKCSQTFSTLSFRKHHQNVNYLCFHHQMLHQKLVQFWGEL